MKPIKINIITFSIMMLMLMVTLAITSCQKSDMAPGTSKSVTAAKIAAPDVPAIIAVPEGYSVSSRAYAQGVQIYISTLTQTGYAWVFQTPSATLYADAGYHGVIGTHYLGPTWESNSGSFVVGTKLQSAASPDPTAIPWLLLGAITTSGPGIFSDVSYIQRVNTVGGVAPSIVADASNVGQEVDVPYTAEYYFYDAD